MKIGILRLPLGIGGAEMSLTEIGATLKQAGHDVWFYFDNGSSHSSMHDFNKFGSIRERCSTSSRDFFTEDALKEDWAIKNLKDTDVVIMIHRHLYSKELVSAINLVKKKIVYAPGKNEHHIYGFYQGIDGFGRDIKNIDKIIFNSHYTYSLHMGKSYPAEYKKLFKHIHPPMDLSFYSSLDLGDSYKIRRELGLEKDTMAVGIFGRLIPSKKPEDAVNIAFELKKRIKDFKFFFIGDGPESKKVESKIKQLNLQNNVKILGMKSFPFNYISAMDVMLHLCEHESMSRALRESMLLKKPVVAYDGAGNRELCAGNLRELLFQNHGQARTKLVRMATEKAERIKYGERSMQRILQMEKEAKKNLLELVKI